MIIKTRKGEEILVDLEDYDLVIQYRWSLNDGYAKACYRYNGHPKTITMHRLITGFIPGTVIRHVNKNRHDNRRSNLQIVRREMCYFC